VEGTVGVVSTFILAALRNQQFLSLRELNESCIGTGSMGSIISPFRRKTGAELPRFEEEEDLFASSARTSFSSWPHGEFATVQYNYHISVDTQNYSCPYEYIKQKVDVRMTRSTVRNLL